MVYYRVCYHLEGLIGASTRWRRNCCGMSLWYIDGQWGRFLAGWVEKSKVGPRLRFYAKPIPEDRVRAATSPVQDFWCRRLVPPFALMESPTRGRCRPSREFTPKIHKRSAATTSLSTLPLSSCLEEASVDQSTVRDCN